MNLSIFARSFGSRGGERRAAAASLRSGSVGVAVFALVLLHRAWLWSLFGTSITATAAANPRWLTWQFLPLQAYTEHFAAALLYLQQTPPLPHLVLGGFAKTLPWPVGVAEALLLLQAFISALTATLTVLLLRRTGASTLVSVAVGLWFGLSTDLYLLEINALGQLFYETGAMLFCTATALCLCAGNARPSARACFAAGLFTGLVALTRASFSFLGLPVLLVVAVRAGPRRAFLALIPLLLLQGGWSLKTALVHGRLSPAMSSWSGMNVANGIVVADVQETPENRNAKPFENADPEPFQTFILAHPGDYPDWLIAILKRDGYVSWEEAGAGADVPPDLRVSDAEAQRAMGGTDPYTNTDALRAISDQYAKAALRYSVAHPLRFLNKLRKGYALFWQPMAAYSGYFMGPLYIDEVRRPIFTTPLLLSHPAVYDRAHPAGEAPLPVALPTLSLIPLDTLAIYALTFGLPLLAAFDLAARSRRSMPWIGPDLWSLIAVAAYGVAVSTAVDLGENMRFRLAFEPVLLAATVGTVRALAGRVPTVLAGAFGRHRAAA